ncbi:hypothetical protein AX774_g5837 [Zancudomyces culisetae]|uniref:Uncharacterized protein n=1 Tax=Zancudomyces culisetae TaxID=1213189 RepID=A0A1R1PIG8_ZANCU|nr:hypothetical protein AX774_g5837 [Zancudomyces culisetae]|eukprot:OMH80719.1 hypothetical protein AX774_g5837 [Zancudomyces culisetae]
MLFVLIAVFTPSNKSVFWIGLPLNVLLRPNLHAILTPLHSGSLKSIPFSTNSLTTLKLPSKHDMLMQGYSEFLGITPPFFIQCSNTSVLSDLQASSNPSDSPFNFAPLLIK